jgi:cephalosporin hydroxylase
MDLAREQPLWDRRVRFLQGSTVDPATLAEVVAIIDDRRTMVILDSDHAAPHVSAELRAYAPLVTPGCYLIVQDGIVSTVDPSYGPGPLEALTAFLADDDRFEVDLSRERQFFTFNPSGFLLRR